MKPNHLLTLLALLLPTVLLSSSGKCCVAASAAVDATSESLAADSASQPAQKKRKKKKKKQKRKHAQSEVDPNGQQPPAEIRSIDDAQAFLSAAGRAHSHGAPDDALRILSRAIELAPDFGPFYAARGGIAATVATTEVDYEPVFRDLHRAVELNPQDVQSVSNLGVAMTTMRRYEEALRHFDEALSINPAHEAALSYRGYVLEQMGNVAEAHASDLRAAETLPDSAQIRFNYAASLRDAGKVYEALREFRALKAAHPDYSPGLVALAQLLVDVEFSDTSVDTNQAKPSNELETSQLAEANNLLRQARRIDPDSSQAALQSCWAASLMCEEKSQYKEGNDRLQITRRCQLDAVHHCREAVRLALKHSDAQICIDAAATEAKILFSAGRAVESLEKYGRILTEATHTFATVESASIGHVTAARTASISTCASLIEPDIKPSQHQPEANVVVIPPQYPIEDCTQNWNSECSFEDLKSQKCSSLPESTVKLFTWQNFTETPITGHVLAVCQRDSGSSGNVRCDLRDLALALEQTARSRQVSNNGGWHSDPQQAGFLDLDNSAHSDRLLAAAAAHAMQEPTTTTAVAQQWARAIGQVRKWVSEQVARYLLEQVDTCCQARGPLAEDSSSCGTHCVCSLEICDLRKNQIVMSAATPPMQLVQQLFRGIFFESSWVNVNRHAQTNARHSHGAVTVSGVFYIDSGFDDGDSTNTPLRVQTPAVSMPDGYPCKTAWSSSDIAASGGHEVSADTELVPVPGSGTAGTLAMWPGYVDHDVQPHTGLRPRISTAFNVWVLV